MAGLATNFDTTTIIVDRPAQLWGGVVAPAAGGRLALGVDPGDSANKSPDATANPAAVHLGFTREGAKVTFVSRLTPHYANEIDTPLFSTVEQTEASIEAELLQVMDEDVLQKVTASFGTYATGSGYKEFAIGKKTLVYTGIALIWPTAQDVTKFAVAHLYQAMNTSGLTFGVDRTKMSGAPVKFEGYAVVSRAAADRVGKYWWEI
jgi:hypothetical protein